MRVLIVVDMQNDFIDGALGTKEAVAVVPRVVEKIRTFQGTVIYTRDTHGRDYLSTAEGKKLPVVHCVKGTVGWEIESRVREACPNAKVIDKPTFGSRELGEVLAEMGIEENIDDITLIGLCTDICVISNAMLLKAFMPETRIVVDASCCAGVTVDSHKQALNAMKVCQIDIINE